MNKFKDIIRTLDAGIKMLKARAELVDRIVEHVLNRHTEQLEEITENPSLFDSHEEELADKVKEKCRELANARGIDLQEVTLGNLIEHLDGKEAMKLQDRRQRLAFAIDEVSEKSRRLRRVAGQARDVEERVAAAVLGTVKDTTTYSEDGSMEQEHQAVAFYQKA